jgi:hypothetical protein
MRGPSTETVPGDGLPNFKRARSALSPISHEEWKEKRASGAVAPGGWMSGLKLAAARKPGPTQHGSSHIQALAPLGCAVSQVVKTAQSRERTERTLLFAGALAGRSTACPIARPTAHRGRRGRRGRRNAADRLNPSLLMSHYCLLHPTHHADKR